MYSIIKVLLKNHFYLIVITLSVTLLSTFLIPINQVSAKSFFDDFFVNQQPLKFKYLNKDKNVSDFCEYSIDYKSITDCVFLLPENWISESFLTQYNNLIDDFFKKNSNHKNWSLFYLAKSESLVFLWTDDVGITTSFGRFQKYGYDKILIIARNNSNKPVTIHRAYLDISHSASVQKFSAVISPNEEYHIVSFPNKPSEIPLERPLHSFIHNFDHEYPLDYEGEILKKEYKILPKLKSDFGYSIKNNVLKAMPKPFLHNHSNNYFNKLKHYWDLFYVYKDENGKDVTEKLLTNFDSLPLEYKLNPKKIGDYVLHLKYAITPPQTEEYDFINSKKTIKYHGEYTNTVGSTSDDFFKDFDKEKEFKYEHCDVLDIPCHIRNLTTKISELFHKLNSFIKDLFVGDTESLVNKFNEFLNSFKLKLGFLFYPIELFPKILAPFYNAVDSCPDFMGNQTFFGAIVNFNPHPCRLSFLNNLKNNGTFLVIRDFARIGTIFALLNWAYFEVRGFTYL